MNWLPKVGPWRLLSLDPNYKPNYPEVFRYVAVRDDVYNWGWIGRKDWAYELGLIIEVGIN